MLMEILKKVGKAFVSLCLSVIMLIALFYLRFYETKPFYTPQEN